MSADVVGQDPWRVAEMAGFRVPRATSLLLAHQDGVGKEHPLSIEILCPLLSIHTVDGWEQGCDTSMALLHYGGLGHTLGVWAEDERVLEAFFLQKPASRIVVNGPTSQGAVGYSTNLVPSVSLGCGPQAGNITSDNISARHLLNIKRAAFPHGNWEADDARDHARAARWSGDVAPRGSGLPGDPAGGASASSVPEPRVELAPRVLSDAESNWQGNPPSLPQAPATRKIPRFTEPAGRASGSAPTVVPRPAPKADDRPSGVPIPSKNTSGPYVGMALAPDEIEGILAHAGSGCPLGPCQGCPHADTVSGACKA